MSFPRRQLQKEARAIKLGAGKSHIMEAGIIEPTGQKATARKIVMTSAGWRGKKKNPPLRIHNH